jgi:meso-butanediol dehydrogenase/(S,S)-butanediol dehydrogenase/diacetyl reductase
MTARFQDRVAFVTGAASGVGRATARRFAAEGAAVFAVDVGADGLAETAAAIRAAGGRVETAVCDVSAMPAVKDAVERAVAAFGGLDVLANVAGIGWFARLEELTAEDFQRIVGVNLGGVFNTTHAAIGHLLRRPGASIVNVGSTASLRGNAYASVYAASKAGILNFTRSIALEFAARGLRANCVCPGGVKTPLGRHFLRRDDFEQHLIDYQMPPKVGTFADPEDIAGAIAFLASDEARMVNGAAFVVDAGTLA